MHRTDRPRVKICCIASVDEAWTAIRAGASALGLVSAMPSGPGVIPDERIAEVAAAAPPGVATFLLTSALDADTIIGQQRRSGANTLQLVDAVPHAEIARVRAALPGIAVVQVIHVTGPESVDEAVAVAPLVNAILLDSGNPALAVKELGGTGRVHDWELSRRIREAVPVPLFLAGGLRPDNVAEAVARVGPFGLDVCGGVRTGGALDPDKLARLIAAAQA
jgi:phosphoribosylanthranilate isomerase